MTKSYGKRERSLSPTDVDHTEKYKYEAIPEEFFCPISKKFISDPVRIPNSNLTYNRKSVKDLHKPEDVVPDLRMRTVIEEWFSHYDLNPPFQFISNQDDVVAASISVAQQLNENLLREFRDALDINPNLLDDGGGIRCVATLLSHQQENLSSDWVALVLSIVAPYDDVEGIFQVPADIHPEYSLLAPISRACQPHLRPAKNEDFQKGLISLVHALVINSPDVSAMAGKLGGIIQALVSYMWPVREYCIHKQYYRKLLSTLERLSENQESCKGMVDAGIIGIFFILFDYGVSSTEELSNNHHKETTKLALGSDVEEGQLMVIKTCLKVLDRVCRHSERARQRIGKMGEDEVDALTKAIYVCCGMNERAAVFKGLRVLDHCDGYPRHALALIIKRRAAEYNLESGDDD